MNPSLDHYIGRPVKSVEDQADGSWTITLEGGVEITNFDSDVSFPDLQGVALLGVADSSLLFGVLVTTDEGPEIRNQQMVNLTGGKYEISDANFSGGQAFNPGTFEQEDTLPPDPSADRVVDQPLSRPENVVEDEKEAGQ